MYKPILFFGVLTLVFAVCILLSIAQPKAMAPWFRPASRFKSMAFYIVLTIIFGTASFFNLPSYPELTREQQIKLYCSYLRGNERIARDTGKMFGVRPRNALNIGDIIVTEQTTPLLLSSDTEFKTVQQVIENTNEVVAIPRNKRIKILRIIRDFSSGFHWYEALAISTGQHGYLESDALQWYDTPARIKDYEQRKEVWMKPKRKELEQKLFTDNGLSPNAIKKQADEEGWNLQCP